MHALENKLEARECAVPHDECQLSCRIQGFSKAQMRTITSALFGGHSGPTCMYCKQSYPSNSCKIVNNSVAEKDLLIKQERCLVCPRKDHLSVRLNIYSCTSRKLLYARIQTTFRK